MFLFKRMWDTYLRTEGENKRKAGFDASRGAVFFTVLLNKLLFQIFSLENSGKIYRVTFHIAIIKYGTLRHFSGLLSVRHPPHTHTLAE